MVIRIRLFGLLVEFSVLKARKPFELTRSDYVAPKFFDVMASVKSIQEKRN
jgi:hypothetical protein